MKHGTLFDLSWIKRFYYYIRFIFRTFWWRMTMMKGFVLRIVFLLLLLLSLNSFSQIQNTAHDFSKTNWANGSVCEVCHADHNSSGNRLWNHQETEANFSLYSSNTLDATINSPNGTSKQCLSCHDGTVAIDSFGGNTGSIMMSSKNLIGVDLRNNHPVSFKYDASLAFSDRSLHDPASTLSGLGGTIDSDLLDSNHQLQCTSCHDIHNRQGDSSLIWKSNYLSGLCITCHNK